MRKNVRTLLPAVLSLSLLQGCASAGARVAGSTFGDGGPTLDPRVTVGPLTTVQLRRPAHVALIEFDGEDAVLVYPTARDSSYLLAGDHRIDTPWLASLPSRRGANQACTGPGEQAFYPSPTQPEPAAASYTRRARYRGRSVICYRPANWSGAAEMGTPRHLLVLVSGEPLAAGELASRIAEFERSLPSLEASPDQLAAELARRVAPEDPRAWRARLYDVRSRRR